MQWRVVIGFGISYREVKAVHDAANRAKEIYKMAETTINAEIPAKTGKTSTATTRRKRTVAEQLKATTPSREEIGRLAEQFWAERGWQDGNAEQDWLRAERTLMEMAS